MPVEAVNLASAPGAHPGEKMAEHAVPAEGGRTDKQRHPRVAKDLGSDFDRAADAADGG